MIDKAAIVAAIDEVVAGTPLGGVPEFALVDESGPALTFVLTVSSRRSSSARSSSAPKRT